MVFVLCAFALAALAFGLSATDHRADPGRDNQLVHWRDAKHDWLLVIEPSSRELVVYDAVDGRPLKRLGATDGGPFARAIVGQGRWLFVMGGQGPQVRLMKLPELREVALDGR